MKQTVEEAAREELNYSYANKYVGNGMFEYGQQAMINMFIRGAIWQEDQAIEILSSVLENWVHGGDADCIIAEFEEKLKNNVWNIQQKQQKGIPSFDEILEANRDVLERIKEKGD